MKPIDADALAHEILEEFGDAVKSEEVNNAVDEIYGMVINAPTIEIVRCGECVHNGIVDTDCPFGWRDGKWNMPKPCDFCSYGERR